MTLGNLCVHCDFRRRWLWTILGSNPEKHHNLGNPCQLPMSHIHFGEISSKTWHCWPGSRASRMKSSERLILSTHSFDKKIICQAYKICAQCTVLFAASFWTFKALKCGSNKTVSACPREFSWKRNKSTWSASCHLGKKATDHVHRPEDRYRTEART